MPGFGVDGQVVDETGLTRAYDFEFDYTRETADRSDAGLLPGPTIFQAMAELGLRLEPTMRSLPVIVVDSAQKPGENEGANAPYQPLVVQFG